MWFFFFFFGGEKWTLLCYVFIIVLKCSHLIQIHNKTKYKILIVLIYFIAVKGLVFIYLFIFLKKRPQDPSFFIL